MPSSNKSASYFCIFPKTKLTEFDLDGTPVYLNVSDLTPINEYLYWAGLCVFHSGVEEYAFGAHNYSISGVFEVEPRQCLGFKFRKSILIGKRFYDAIEIREFFELEASKYSGNSYHLTAKNCNHFCEDICRKFTRKKIPKWVNRLARIGSICNCVLPETFKPSSVRRDRTFDSPESETKRLKSSSSKFPSISKNTKRTNEFFDIFASSLTLKALTPHQKLKKSENGSFRKLTRPFAKIQFPGHYSNFKKLRLICGF